MARSSPPTICTSPTPVDRSRTTLTVLSAISVSSRIDRLPESATAIVADCSLFCFWMIGGSTSSGSRRMTDATRSRTSCAAVSMSRSRSKVMTTSDWPGAGDRAQLGDALDLIDGFFEDLGDLCFHLLDRGAGQGRPDHDVGRSTAGKRSMPRRKNEAAPIDHQRQDRSWRRRPADRCRWRRACAWRAVRWLRERPSPARRRRRCRRW